MALWTLAVLVPSLLGGMQFVFCRARQRAHFSCCCHRAPARSADPPAVTNQCCEGRRVQSLPTSPAAVHPVPFVAPSPMVAWLTLAELFPEVRDPLARPASESVPEARAGPEPPLFELHRVYRL